MPKPSKTPPPPDDEPKYLVVVNPYPLRANMELMNDRKDFVLWLACCTGKDPLIAFFHKPKVRSNPDPYGRADWATECCITYGAVTSSL